MTANQGFNVGAIYYDCDLETKGLLDGARRADRVLDQLATKLTATASAVGILGATLAALKVAKLADEIRMLSARVDVAAGSAEKGAAAFASLVGVSQRTQTSLEGNIEVFNRLNQSILAMGGTQRDTLNVTELLSKAIKVSGASAVEAKAAMLQFGQALGSGKLQGDELRSLMETAPYLMRQLADGIGVPVGALKKLGEEGKLTADVVTNALTKAAKRIDEDFQKLPQTFEAAMTVAQDQAALAALKFDDLAGGSAVLAGLVKGLGDVLEQLGNQFAAATTEADKLGRNSSIKSWADGTVLVLSYVADAGDLVSRMFRQMGTLIGGVAAATGQLATGNLPNAAKTIAQMKADIEGIGNAKYAGAKMRQALEAPQASYSNEGRGSSGQTSKLKSAVDDDNARKLKAKREEAKAYLQGLVADNAVALDRIDAEEKKALAENAKRQAEDKNNSEIYAKARVEIARKYARERAIVEEQASQQIADINIANTTDEVERVSALRDEAFRRADAQVRMGILSAEEAERTKVMAMIAARAGLDEIAERNERARAARELAITKDQSAQIAMIRDEAIRQAQDGYERGKLTFDEAEQAKTKALMDAEAARLALRQQRESAATTTLQYRASTGGPDAQEALIRQQAEAALRAVEEARQRDLEASQIYADQKVAIEEDMNRRIAEMRASANMAALGATADALGAVLNVMQKAGKDQTGVFKAIFAAQKAFSIAQSIVAIQTGIANAAALPFPANLGAMASVIAATASIVSTIQGTSYGGGRQYGGPVAAGSAYRVGESNRPEMFVGDSGRSYMIPGEGGKVIGNGDLGGGNINITIVNPQGQPMDGTASGGRDRNGDYAIKVILSAVADDLASGGRTARAVQSRFNLQT